VAYYSPLFMQSNAMLDAARSRHSLNERALEMFASNPLLGAGSGMGPHYEQVTWPHYRVNGVDTHGVIQKIASETGLLGLAGYGLFMSSTGVVLLRRRRRQSDAISQAALCTWATLHTNLLLSTEVLSPTHWLPFAVAWGMVHRIPICHDEDPDGPYISPPTRR
jgi:O-antigen ligase